MPWQLHERAAATGEEAGAAAEPAAGGSSGEEGYEPHAEMIGNLKLEEEPLPSTDHMLSGLEGKFQDGHEEGKAAGEGGPQNP